MSPNPLLNASKSDRNAVIMLVRKCYGKFFKIFKISFTRRLWKVFVINARVMFKLINILIIRI
jgi:hypothetical protein